MAFNHIVVSCFHAHPVQLPSAFDHMIVNGFNLVGSLLRGSASVVVFTEFRQCATPLALRNKS
jgi:hypothetical protein